MAQRGSRLQTEVSLQMRQPSNSRVTLGHGAGWGFTRVPGPGTKAEEQQGERAEKQIRAKSQVWETEGHLTTRKLEGASSLLGYPELALPSSSWPGRPTSGFLPAKCNTTHFCGLN